MQRLTVYLLIVFLFTGCSTVEEDRIRPWGENPFYWQYRGEPVMLLGTSKDDNLFQQEGLREHLDEMAASGGNYIRNTMSGRDVGGGNEVRAWLKNEDGLYDLTRPNREYWNRFDSLLKWTYERDIFVQVEIWATHDLFGEEWERSPWNPVNNINYETGNTSLDTVAPDRAFRPHPFFFTIPEGNCDPVVLGFQQMFVNELMRHSLPYGHVLYCITNEIQHAQSEHWSWYWAGWIREAAAEKGRYIEVTEMYWAPDLKDDQHRLSLDHPEIYSFFEASQNSAKSGRENWDNLQYIRARLDRNPRPVNSVKIYGKTDSLVTWPGTDEEAIDRFWRSLLGGCASARFHRNENGVYGLGFSEDSRNSVAAARRITGAFPPWQASPAMHLLNQGEDQNIAYAAEIPGESVLVYFTRAGRMLTDLSDYRKIHVVLWTNVRTGQQIKAELTGGKPIELETPGEGKWLAHLK